MNKLLIIIFFFSTSFSFGQRKNDYQAECFSSSNDGEIVIKIWNPKKGKKYKLNDARKDALDLLLFSGITANNSCTKLKPLLNNQNEIDAFNKIKQDFFSKNGLWSRYTKSSNFNNKELNVYYISISESQLRLMLEEKKIIKSLNSAF